MSLFSSMRIWSPHRCTLTQQIISSVTFVFIFLFGKSFLLSLDWGFSANSKSHRFAQPQNGWSFQRKGRIDSERNFWFFIFFLLTLHPNLQFVYNWTREKKHFVEVLSEIVQPIHPSICLSFFITTALFSSHPLCIHLFNGYWLHITKTHTQIYKQCLVNSLQHYTRYVQINSSFLLLNVIIIVCLCSFFYVYVHCYFPLIYFSI